MATNDPMWKTLVEAAADLKDTGDGDFSWSELMKRARSLDPSHYESAFGPVFQSMVIESPTPAVTPLGKVFTRVSRGTYELQSVPDEARTTAPKLLEESVVRSITETPSKRDLRYRSLQLSANFDAYVAYFASHVPFTKPREFELHRLTIDRRRALGSVDAALQDEAFLDALFATLILRGIGTRGTKLVARTAFANTLRAHQVEISGLERFSIDDAGLDVAAIAERVSALSDDLGIVESAATVEPGSKALHYLLPDLVPALDRRWSGKFFRWRQQDPLAHSQRDLERSVHEPRPRRVPERTFATTRRGVELVGHRRARQCPDRLLPIRVEVSHRTRRAGAESGNAGAGPSVRSGATHVASSGSTGATAPALVPVLETAAPEPTQHLVRCLRRAPRPRHRHGPWRLERAIRWPRYSPNPRGSRARRSATGR